MVILDTTIKIEVIGHYVKEVSKMSKKFNRTPAEEILLSVQQWYLSRGLRVPADELKICKDDIEKERILNEYNGAVFTKRLLEYQHDLIKEEGGDDYYEKAANLIERIAAQNKIIAGTSEADRPKEPAPSKVSYGSSDFWKEHWAKKKAAGWVPKEKTPKSKSKGKKGDSK